MVTRFYLPELDGLRFLAASAVFVTHAAVVAGFPWPRYFGWWGVDLFLCLSAFLITKLIVLEYQQTGGFKLAAFYARRALRIWPLYFTYVTFACLLALLGMDAVRVFAWWLGHLTFSNNLMTAALGFVGPPFTPHLWTISLEEQAYLLLPPILMAWLTRGSSERIALACIIGAMVLLLAVRLSLVLAGQQYPQIYVTPLRSDAFLVGIAAAIWGNRFRITPAILLMALVGFFVSALLCAGRIHPGPIFEIIGYPLVATGFGIVILYALQCPNFGYVFRLRPVRYLGKISYGIYVYHYFCIYVAVRVFEGKPNVVIMIAGLVLTIMVSAASYAILERPFLKLKNRFAVIQSRPI